MPSFNSGSSLEEAPFELVCPSPPKRKPLSINDQSAIVHDRIDLRNALEENDI